MTLNSRANFKSAKKNIMEYNTNDQNDQNQRLKIEQHNVNNQIILH